VRVDAAVDVATGGRLASVPGAPFSVRRLFLTALLAAVTVCMFAVTIV